MTVILILLVSIAILVLGGHVYSTFLARSWGEQPDRITPAVRLNDGHDYVPTPTPVVFAHHFASIAGAGPIIGPVIAVCYGWLPAVLWVVFGGMLIGAVHDYLATFMSTRMSGQSMATVVRRLLGTGPFVALVIFLVLLLALVCATFLNLSAAALVSLVPCNRLDLDSTQTIFRTVNEQVVIGGIASTSVIVITALAPFVGWLYIKKRVAVWKCSVLALVICAISIVFGLYVPVSVAASTWKVILAIYVLLAAGLPVWLFLQSRDFINVHILYIGLSLLAATVVVAACRGASVPAADALPALDLASGSRAMGFIWPGLFITVACGAVSGFHSLCAGGTTCKQLVSEPAARRIGYWGMVLESVLAITVICVLLLGLRRADYLADVHPALVGLKTSGNPILSFAMSVGFASHAAFGLPIAVGALGGMILLEGFLQRHHDLVEFVCDREPIADRVCPRAGRPLAPADRSPGLVHCGAGSLHAGHHGRQPLPAPAQVPPRHRRNGLAGWQYDTLRCQPDAVRSDPVPPADRHPGGYFRTPGRQKPVDQRSPESALG